MDALAFLKNKVFPVLHTAFVDLYSVVHHSPVFWETMGEIVSSLDPVSDTDIEHPKAPSSCRVRIETGPVAEGPASDLRDSEDDLGRVEDPVKMIWGLLTSCFSARSLDVDGQGEDERQERKLRASNSPGLVLSEV